MTSPHFVCPHCGESDAYCSTCAEPVLRRQRDEARAALACIEYEILQMDCGPPADTPYWRIVSTLRVAEEQINAAPTPGGAEGETG